MLSFLYSNLSFSLFAFKTVYSYFIYKVRLFYGKKKGGEEIEELRCILGITCLDQWVCLNEVSNSNRLSSTTLCLSLLIHALMIDCKSHQKMGIKGFSRLTWALEPASWVPLLATSSDPCLFVKAESIRVVHKIYVSTLE